MAAQDEGGIWSKLGGGSVVAMLLVALGFTALPPQGWLISHPTATPGARPPAFEGGRLEARLWQDPLAFLNRRDPVAPGDPGLPEAEVLAQLLAAPPGQPPAAAAGAPPGKDAAALLPGLMAVMMRPGSWAEAAESRRRTRVAVVSGLFAEGYVASDPDLLQRRGDTAFEWYLPVTAAPGRRPLLVLWVPEDRLMPDPAGQLLARRSAAYDAAQVEQAPPWQVIGPADSGSLDGILAALPPERLRAACAGQPLPEPPGVHFFTGFATKPVDCVAPADRPGGAILPAAPAAGSANQGLAGTGVTRVTATDQQLAAALVEELSDRSVSPFRNDEFRTALGEWVRQDGDAPDDAIALVTEADSVYGRAMAEIFCRQFAAAAERPLPSAQPCEAQPPARAGFFHFTYLRGLNGELGGRAGRASAAGAASTSTAGAAAPAPGSGDAASASAATESDATGPGSTDPGAAGVSGVQSEGDAQADYLGRLADQLSALDQRLRAGVAASGANAPRQPRRALRAVGLLGSDLYDKLMLLRALKPRLPDTIFFTTDLDARLLDAGQLPTTRNLLLTSGYDLQLPGPAQAGLPGFRDTYQTASYFATRLALEQPDGQFNPSQRACLDALVAQVHLYEIGRSGPVEFSLPGLPSTCSQAQPALLQAAPPDPPAPLWSLHQRIGLGLSLIGLVLFANLWTLPALRYWLRARFTEVDDGIAARRLLGGFLLMLLAALGLASLVAAGWPSLLALAEGQGRGQPFLWASGVSVWPPLLAILLATLIALVLALRVPGRLLVNLCRQHDWLGFEPGFDALLREVKRSMPRERAGTRLLRDFLPVSMWRGAVPAEGASPAPPAVEPAGAQGAAEDKAATVDPDASLAVPAFWRCYLRSGMAAARWRRLALVAVLVGTVVVVLNNPIDNHLPLRGIHTARLYTGCNDVAMGMLLLLMAMVAEASLFCADFLELLPDCAAAWPAGVVQRFARQLGVDAPLAVAWLQLQVAARRSAAVTPLIYLPFAFLAVLILSHSTVFSPWHASVQQDVVIACAAGVTVFCAWRLRRAAEAVRRHSLDAVEEAALALAYRPDADEGRRGALQRLDEALRGESAGALAPFGSQPWLRALLPPLLSFASSTALEVFGLR